MTRITNFGRKRTYLDAGFSTGLQDGSEPQPRETQAIANASKTEENVDTAAPPKKKRKRTKPSMRDGNTGVKAALEHERKQAEAEAKMKAGVDEEAPLLTKSAKKREREKNRKQKFLSVSSTEYRRQARIQDKLSATTCFACREKGHAAKDCPTAKKLSNEGSNVVGICYRCGSTKHNLSRCKKTANKDDPYPHALCFVCNKKGHLVSSCPQNKTKGVYPDGGCCKLCGDNTHLAKDCGLGKRDVVEPTTILGTGSAAGADEDDFHSFKRHKTEVDRVEKRKDKLSRSGTVKTSSSFTEVSGSLPTRKVVNF